MTDVDIENERVLLSQGYTLPYSWYSDPDVFELEKELIFRRSWQYVGHVSQMAQPGVFKTLSVGEVPVVVVRDESGRLRAFVNVCAHRGNIVMTGAGSCQTLQCPYHAWTYGLDGRLRAAPRSDREDGFNKADFRLSEISVDVWEGFIFVHLDAQPHVSLIDTMADLGALLRRSGLKEIESLHFWGRREFILDVNWKVAVENFLECYHCPVVHQSFSSIIDMHPDRFKLRATDWILTQAGPLRDSVVNGHTADLPYDPIGEVIETQSHLIWPFATLNVVPGPPNLSPLIFEPVTAEQTRVTAEYYFAEGADTETVRRILNFLDEVGEEDRDLVVSVHRGLRSSALTRGRLMLKSEDLIHRFQRLVFDAIT